ncbi:hypothetical protein WME79_38405 [Sorangium sp. So ce726]|uniref:hypothetical protein n=1 Tax=Sorangium sp. So ce726 TaxID=3133319 RepID=UPI003F613063
MPADCTIPEGAVLPGELRCTGLYGDWERRSLACGVMEYAPAYSLWADGAEKRRYAWIPPGEKVDVTDPDDFRYPVGTQFWKEFLITDGGGRKLGETRLMRRVAAGWMYTTYVWDADATTAVQTNDGVTKLLGTEHTVPSREECKECHSGRRDFILGWDALMLGEGATGLTRRDLVERGLVTWKDKDAGAPDPLELSIPGDAVEKAALGYLHANCGVSCHNDSPRALAQESGFFTRLDHGALGSVLETPVWVTGLERAPSPNAPLSVLPPPPGGGSYVDLRPLDTERSLMLVRMRRRNEDAAMPRQGTTQVDAEGVALIERWVQQMTPERGYPPPAP